MPREIFIETPSYRVEWEDIEGFCNVHCYVEKWSPSVLKELYKVFYKLKVFVRELGYERMYSQTPNPKFCELFGSTYLGTLDNGHEVVVWAVA